LSYFDALKEVEKEDAQVPNHLRDASRDAESFGHGEGYIYPHAYRDHWAAQQYLPNSLRGRTFYIPSTIGYEGKIREDVLQKRELQAAVILSSQADDSSQEILSWSSSSKGREGWFKRLESGRSKLLLGDRNKIFASANPSRQARILIPAANDGLLLWESLRRCPEGLSAALVSNQAASDALLRYAEILDEIESPQIAISTELIPTADQCCNWFSCSQFDHILLRISSRLNIEALSFVSAIKPLLANTGNLVMLFSPAHLGERLSRILLCECGKKDAASKLEKAEELFFQEQVNISHPLLAAAFEEQGFTVNIELIDQKEERLITEKDLTLWFNFEQSRWGSFMYKNLGKDDFSAIEDALRLRITKGPILWQWKSVCLKVLKC
jgi:putative ATPase